jgi:hypothetical protein
VGIDYGRGLTNIDKDTGIRYGVIHNGEVLQAWCDSSEAVFPDDYDEEEICDGPLDYAYEKDGYKCFQFADDTDIFIEKSPYYTYCGFCSPCAPGAGYLMDEGNVKAYCFDHDWFEDGIAPYKVYDVKTNKEVME